MQTAEPLTHRLRAETALPHQRLEARLNLLKEPLERHRFVETLSGFYGFHAVWEPAIEALVPNVMAGRKRLRLLADDLRALGVTRSGLAALPLCAEAATLTRDLPTALGSLYVMEGSTLGGAVIVKALSGAPWLPAGGLRYFSPYGRGTGGRWRQTLSLLENTPSVDDASMIAGAVATFDLLERWLPGERAQAA